MRKDSDGFDNIDDFFASENDSGFTNIYSFFILDAIVDVPPAKAPVVEATEKKYDIIIPIKETIEEVQNENAAPVVKRTSRKSTFGRSAPIHTAAYKKTEQDVSTDEDIDSYINRKNQPMQQAKPTQQVKPTQLAKSSPQRKQIKESFAQEISPKQKSNARKSALREQNRLDQEFDIPQQETSRPYNHPKHELKRSPINQNQIQFVQQQSQVIYEAIPPQIQNRITVAQYGTPSRAFERTQNEMNAHIGLFRSPSGVLYGEQVSGPMPTNIQYQEQQVYRKELLYEKDQPREQDRNAYRRDEYHEEDPEQYEQNAERYNGRDSRKSEKKRINQHFSSIQNQYDDERDDRRRSLHYGNQESPLTSRSIRRKSQSIVESRESRESRDSRDMRDERDTRNSRESRNSREEYQRDAQFSDQQEPEQEQEYISPVKVSKRKSIVVRELESSQEPSQPKSIKKSFRIVSDREASEDEMQEKEKEKSYEKVLKHDKRKSKGKDFLKAPESRFANITVQEYIQEDAQEDVEDEADEIVEAEASIEEAQVDHSDNGFNSGEQSYEVGDDGGEQGYGGDDQDLFDENLNEYDEDLVNDEDVSGIDEGISQGVDVVDEENLEDEFIVEAIEGVAEVSKKNKKAKKISVVQDSSEEEVENVPEVEVRHSDNDEAESAVQDSVEEEVDEPVSERETIHSLTSKKKPKVCESFL